MVLTWDAVQGNHEEVGCPHLEGPLIVDRVPRKGALQNLISTLFGLHQTGTVYQDWRVSLLVS